jgi:hypothetical protein
MRNARQVDRCHLILNAVNGAFIIIYYSASKFKAKYTYIEKGWKVMAHEIPLKIRIVLSRMFLVGRLTSDAA